MDLLQIALVDGVPQDGTGNVATINALMADGGQATLGHTTDPADYDTGANAATMIGILTALSAILQDIRLDWPAALGAGGGLKVDGSGTALPVSIASLPTHNVFVQQNAHTATSAFTCGTTAYAAGDVVGGILTFAGIASGAAVISIDEVALRIDTNAIISGETTYRLYLYSASPPSNYADGAAWDLPSGDRASFLGYIDIPNVVDLGSTIYVQTTPTKRVKTAGGTIYGYLVSNGAYTPPARDYKVTLQARDVG